MTLIKRDERFPEKGAALSAYKLQTHRYFTCAVNSFKKTQAWLGCKFPSSRQCSYWKLYEKGSSVFDAN